MQDLVRFPLAHYSNHQLTKETYKGHGLIVYFLCYYVK